MALRDRNHKVYFLRSQTIIPKILCLDEYTEKFVTGVEELEILFEAI